MLPQYLDLKYFLCVCESKNISRAAEILGISQPSLSLAMKRLETIAGINLLVRTNSGVDLTRAGYAFKERALELLELWQSISDDIKRSADEVSGRYTIGAHVSVTLTGLIPIVKRLMDTYQGLEFNLSHGLSRIITDQVINFDIDFGVVVNPVFHADLVIREIHRDVVGFFASEENCSLDVLIYDPNLLQSQSLLRAIKSLELKFRRTITSTSLEVIGSLGKAGVGVALLPERAARHVGGLVHLANNWPLFHDRHYLIYRADHHKTKSSRMLARDLASLLMAREQI